MPPPAPTPAASPLLSRPLSSTQEDRLRHLPAPARDAFVRFQTTADPTALDTVVFSVVADHLPRVQRQPLASLPGDTRLIDDLGFDSLAITEAVFGLEDLFAIGISNQEIVLVRTLDDLRSFVRRKVAVRPTG